VLGMLSDALTQYLDEIGRHPLLTAQEERRLARAGDTHRLVECNLRLVVAIARRYRGLGFDLLDLIQEGNVGLIAAAERYDGRRESRFATYAQWWIRREIFRALASRSRMIRLPLRVAEAAARVNRAERELDHRLGRRPSDDEVACAARVDADAIAVLRASRAIEPLADTLSDDGRGDPARLVEGGTVVVRLPERSRRIVELRYGLDGRPARTLDEVARELELSRERVRKLERQALVRLADAAL
jgi:RNA polymerase sigma factor (sigma-70 family)